MSNLRICVALALASGCFTDPPAVADDDGAGTSSETSASVPPTSESGSDSSTGGVTSTSADASSSEESSESSSDTTHGESSSTGEEPCACAGDELLCATFEPPFDPDEPPFAVAMGGADPTIVGDPVHCGRAALRTAVQLADPYSAVNVALDMQISGPGPHRVRTWIRMEASCTDAQTRILQVQFPGSAAIWYQWALYTAPAGLELRMQNHASVVEFEQADAAFDTGTWHELELEFDVTTMPPRGSVRLDGEVVIDQLAGPPLSSMAVFDQVQFVQFGIYRDGAPFPNGCIAVYDDVAVTTL